MFKNLDAEQARHSYTNQRMADMVGISRVSYENKKKTGKFTALEAKKMCKIFKVKFDYLFATDDDAPRAHEQNVPEAPDPVYGREYQEKNSKIF